jgi:hypothetical protein
MWVKVCGIDGCRANGRPQKSIFDFAQGVTGAAREKTKQDARPDMKGRAKKLLDRVG